MAKKDKNVISITADTAGKAIKQLGKVLAKGINQPTERDFIILEAQIKDDFCHFKYEIISGVGKGFEHGVPGSVVITDDTEPGLRDKILLQFKKGIIKCVINVRVLTTGFDYPELEAVLIARSTMSLALYYQIVGRAMRPHKLKEEAWIVDLGGNIDLFGKIESLRIVVDEKGKYSIWNNVRQLTNVTFKKAA